MTAVTNSVISGTGNITDFGTYTPTVTNGTNVASSTPRAFQYSRIGDTVTASGIIDLTFTAPTSASDLEFSLPIASNFTQTWQCAGCGTIGVSSVDAMSLDASVANNRVVANTAQGIDGSYSFIFTYVIV